MGLYYSVQTTCFAELLMEAIYRLAGIAAVVMFLAFFMHLLNAWYIEPMYLGFHSFADYANPEKLRNAIGTVAWTVDGIGFLLNGFATFFFGLLALEAFSGDCPIAARLASLAAFSSAIGFLLVGIVDLMGGTVQELLANQNVEQAQAIFLSAGFVRVIVRGLAIVSFGWFALQFSWCGLHTSRLPKTFCYFGYLTGLAGLSMAFAYIPIHSTAFLIYSFWLAIVLFRNPPRRIDPLSQRGSNRI